jgi:hypothetical protein
LACIQKKPQQVARQESPVTARLIEMLQTEERLEADPNIPPDSLELLSRQHRDQVYEFLAQAVIATAEDLVRAARILARAGEQSPESVLLAHHLAVTAVDEGMISAKVTAATTLDRYLALIDEPQKYGTQYITDSAGNRLLYPVDTLVTDSQRAAWGIDPLDSLRARLQSGEAVE